MDSGKRSPTSLPPAPVGLSYRQGRSLGRTGGVSAGFGRLERMGGVERAFFFGTRTTPTKSLLQD